MNLKLRHGSFKYEEYNSPVGLTSAAQYLYSLKWEFSLKWKNTRLREKMSKVRIIVKYL